jgi:hypothetical protein
MSARFWSVQVPPGPSKLRVNMESEGRIKNMKANKKKGKTPIHAHENVVRGGRAEGTSPCE